MDILSTTIQIISITGQIFAVLNPVGVIPTFLSLTEAMSPVRRHKIVRQSILTVLILTTILAIGGSLILEFFKVSVFSLQIGGGVLLMVIAIDMLSGLPRTKVVESGEEIAIVPIATPLLVGPGTMTTIIVLSKTVPMFSLLTSIIIVAVLTYLLLRYSDLLIKVLGINGIRAISRFMTIIIAAFAAQLLYGGFTGWLTSWGII
ncbi:MAG: multiple antibiotic resistance protein [Archaeoglobaceae archaeon]|nr:multiple antibiotic resistance protein [Archaeoglobaceae archaeon]MDK2876186.1 multiple antibiotic resistance protein [Archaeoglobaceae archaeon]